MDIPLDLGAVILDFHGVLTDSALPGLDLPALREDPATAEALARLERGEAGMAEFLAALPPREPSGRRLRIRARPAVVSRVLRLSACGVATVLLTNTFRGFAGIRASAGVPDDLFDLVVESWRHGVRKPEPGIYSVALDALGVPAAACLFLDDEEPNVKAAREIGFLAMQVDSEDDVVAALDVVLAAVGERLRSAAPGPRPRS
jgi:putative hydrolase of the HAD superfamily